MSAILPHMKIARHILDRQVFPAAPLHVRLRWRSAATFCWQWTTSASSTWRTTKPSSVSSRRRRSRDECCTSCRSDSRARRPQSAPSTSDRCGPTGCHCRRAYITSHWRLTMRCFCAWLQWTHNIALSTSNSIITFRVSRRRREMYSGHARLCVCLCACLSVCMSVPRRIPTLLHGPGCNLGNGMGAP